MSINDNVPESVRFFNFFIIIPVLIALLCLHHRLAKIGVLLQILIYLVILY